MRLRSCKKTVMPFVLAGVFVALLAGCKRSEHQRAAASKPAAVSTAGHESRLRLALNRFREEFPRAEGADSDAADRINHILSLLPHPGAFEHKGYIFTAPLFDEPDAQGADQCRVQCVACKRAIREVDLFDSNGKQIGVCHNPQIMWVATNEGGTIALFVADFYIAPSVFEPTTHPVSPEVMRGKLGRYGLVMLPPRTNIKKVSVQIVFAGGWKSDSVPIWEFRP